MTNEKPKKIFVAMSGGVDSSVAALLLKEAGYDVTGAFIRGWQPDWAPCTWRDEARDAARACAALGVPFATCDLEQEYKCEVGDYIVREYAAGRTPNPDVLCNQKIKFGAFLDWALAHGAERIATGHYARVRERDGRCELLAGIDTRKDQSYFLWTLSQAQLARVRFPVGDLEKPRVRALARRAGLPTAEKKDSQGICFLGEVSMREFLQHSFETRPGVVLDERGSAIGTHDGAALYTLGQRHGFRIGARAPDSPARYVVATDIAANTITTAMESSRAAFGATEFALESVNWISGGAPSDARVYTGRFRYRQPLLPCRIIERGARVRFETPQEVAAGQSFVTYDGAVCLGGGVVA